MAFHEVLFPTNIGYGSSGGPTRRTDIVTLDSGYEQRNTPWAHARRRYNITYGLKTYDDLHTLITFWEARAGQLHGFRFRDFSDYKSCAPLQTAAPTDQLLGTGDASDVTWQLIKTYTSGSNSYVRTIAKPVSGTVRVALNDVEQLSGWSVDTTTGLITFVSAPGSGVSIKAGYHFDVPVRFEADQLVIDQSAFRHGESPDIMLTELRI